jgi:phage terminase large subunit-like protein
MAILCLSGVSAMVVGKADRRGNLYPTKQRPDQKIDAAVAVMMALGRAICEEDPNAGLDGFLSNPLYSVEPAV